MLTHRPSWCGETRAVACGVEHRQHPRTDSIPLSVETGIVKHTGYVTSRAEKLRAEEAVRRVKGVRAVEPAIQVRALGRMGREVLPPLRISPALSTEFPFAQRTRMDET